MSKGKDFEILIACIERIVHDLPGATVKHNVFLPTRYGEKRQIDILITEERGRFTYKTIIECKNTEAKVSVNIVGAFRDLMLNVGAHQGIIVSASGFQKGAVKLAQQSNIFLYQFSHISEVERHLSERRFYVYEINHTIKDAIVKYRNGTPINDVLTFNTKLFSPHHSTEFTVLEIAKDFLNKEQDKIADTFLRSVNDPFQPQKINGTTTITIQFPFPVIFAANGCYTEITDFDAIIETNVSTAPSVVKNVSEYRDIVELKTHALIFEIDHNGKAYKVVDKG